MHNFSNLFDKILYLFRRDPLSIIRSISTSYTRNRYLSVGCLLAVGTQQRKWMVVDPVNQYRKLYLQLYELLVMGVYTQNK